VIPGLGWGVVGRTLHHLRSGSTGIRRIDGVCSTCQEAPRALEVGRYGERGGSFDEGVNDAISVMQTGGVEVLGYYSGAGGGHNNDRGQGREPAIV